MQTVYNIGTKGKFYGEAGGHMSQSTILDTQKCEHETASILNNFTIAFGKVHWGLPNFENLDELFENQQFVLMLCVKASSERSDLYLNNDIFNVITGGVICVRRSDKILWNHCCCDNMQILWLPFTMKCVSDCSCEGADVLNDFLCGKLSPVGYNTQLIDYSDFLRKRVCSYTKCCLNQVLSGFILDCIFTLKQNYDGLSNKDKITQYLLDHATEKISVPELAKKLSISERALFYYFQDNFGSTPSNYINRIRMNAAAEHIHGRQFRAFQSIHILIKRNVRPVTCEYRPTKWINLAKPLMPESRPAQAKVTQTGSAEQAAHFQHDKAPVDALDVPNWGAWPAE